MASITDIDNTRSRSALAQAQHVAAANDLESSRAALEAIIGEEPNTLAPLRQDVTLPRPFPSDVTTWVQRAVEDNPNVEAAVTTAEFEIDRNRSQRLPSADLVATYDGNYSGGNTTEPVNYDTKVRDKQISVQVSVPLIDGGRHARAGR